MNKPMKILISLPLLLLALPSIAAPDPAAGKAKAAVCSACHGQQGKATIPGYPHLAGQRADYLESSLKAYRDGGRSHPLMNSMAKPLSDADVANLAAWYASLPGG